MLNTVGLPPEVAAQAKLVDDFMKGANPDENTANAAPGEEFAPNTEVATPPNAEEIAEQTTATELQPSAEKTAEVPTTQEAVATTATQNDLGVQLEQSQAAYRVLQGKYNAEVPRLLKEIQDIRNEMEGLRQAPATAETTAVQQRTSTTSPELKDLSTRYQNALIGGDEDEAAELFNQAVTLVAQNAVRSEMEPLRQSAAITRDERYVTDLNTLATGWKELRTDPGFEEFLNQAAPFSGTPLKDILKEADGNRDAVRVAEIYNAFAQNKGTGAQTTSRELPAHLTSPARGSGTGGPTPQPKVITPEQLQEAAANVGKGTMTSEAYSALQTQYYAQNANLRQ